MPSKDLPAMIKRHEGFRRYPYKDSVGKLTIGYGRNLDDVGISEEEADVLLAHDIANAIADLKQLLPNAAAWPEPAYHAMVDMMFNLGARKFKTFKRMIAAARRDDRMIVALEMRDSLWAAQVGTRAEELARMVEG